MRSAAALRASHHSLYPAAPAALRHFVCREDAPAYHVPSADTASVPASHDYPVERSLRQADALALSLRTGLDRIAIPLARAAAAFVQRQAWTDFGFARLEDHARERFGRSGRWVKDSATLGAALQSLPLLADSMTGDDGGRPIGRVAALLVVRIASSESLPAWVALARRVPIRSLRNRSGQRVPPAPTRRRTARPGHRTIPRVRSTTGWTISPTAPSSASRSRRRSWPPSMRRSISTAASRGAKPP